jgi:membrane protease YdiL (CAAX protease family)
MYAADSHNPWLRRPRNARFRWGPWSSSLAALLFSGTVLGFFKSRFGKEIYADIARGVEHLPPPWPDALPYCALQTLIFGLFLAAAIAFTAAEGRRPWRRIRGSTRALAVGLVIGSGGYLAAVGVATLAGAIAAPVAMARPPLGPVVLGAAVVALQAISEEAFFRGWLQPVLCGDWGPWPGLLSSSMLFAALHIIAGAHGAVAVVTFFLGGLLFGLLALRTGGLVAPAAAHFAWNWTESGALGLSADPTGSLISLKFAGPALWNGGPDAMNGSLASILVLLALTGALFALRTGSRD